MQIVSALESHIKRQSPVRGSARSTAMSADYIYALVVEALPFIVPSNLTGGTGDASVDKVSQQNDRQCRSYHRAPSFWLSSYIDPWITAQMFVIILTTKVFYSGVNVSFVIIFKVILSFIFGHIITSSVDCFVVGASSCLVRRYGRMGNGQCEPVGWLVVGENYQSAKENSFFLSLMHYIKLKNETSDYFMMVKKIFTIEEFWTD